MKKIVFSLLSLLFVSCVWEPPSPGSLDGYNVVFDDTDLCNGNISVNIFGHLEEDHKNPVVHIFIKYGSKYISTNFYKVNESAEHLVCNPNTEKTEYCICLESEDINYAININMSDIKESGNYDLCCWIKADCTDTNSFDSYFKCLKFSIE